MKGFARFVRLAAGMLALASLGAQAGGPLSVCNDAGKTPLAYSPPTVNLNYDIGNLGARTKAQADTIVTSSVALWTNVGTATISIGRGVDLPVDVTSANYLAYIGGGTYGDGLNPVVYDNDGSIIDLIFGVGAKNSVLGFAGSAYFLNPTCRYAEGKAVINGFYPTDDTTMKVVMAHEIGHLIGMDHTQLDNTQGLSSASGSSNYPLMYPIAYRDFVSLHEDDAAAVSALYPDVTLNSVYGQISGTFVQSNGVTPVLGANLWATETTTGKVYSIVSDYLTQGTGYFKLLLPAGTYNLRAEAIQSNFTGGSSVGPYSELSTDPSFQFPLYSGSTPMSTLTLGNGTPTAFTIIPSCAATLTFRFDGTGTVGGNCGNAPAAITSPAPGTSLTSSSQLFTWNNAGATVYQLLIGSALNGNDIATSPASSSPSFTAAGIPTDGRILYVRLASQFAGVWYYNYYTYTALLPPPAAMVSPTPSTSLASSTQLFTWNSVAGASLYQVTVGNSVGATDIGIFPLGGTAATSISATGLPADGRTLYVRLYTQFHGVWYSRDYTYTALVPPRAAMVSPTPGTSLASSAQLFTWNSVAGGSLYQVAVGNSVGATDIGVFPIGGTAATSFSATGLPTDGRTLYVRLYTQFEGVWYSRDYTYTAFLPPPAAMITPAPSSTLAGNAQTFTWNSVGGASQYRLWVGTALGANDVGESTVTTAGTSMTVSRLPTEGGTLYVRLSSQFNGTFYSRDYTYTAFTAPGLIPAPMVSPAPGSVLAGSSQTFTWANTGAMAYQVWVGNTFGSYDIGYSPDPAGSGTSATVSGIPTDGRMLFVRVYSNIGGTWLPRDYTYVASSVTPPSATLAAVASPVPGSTLSEAGPTFTWNNSGASLYKIAIGTTPGASDIGEFPSAAGTNATALAVRGVPLSGNPVYVRLSSNILGVWVPVDYVYNTVAPVTATPASIVSPAPGSALAPTQTFTWSDSGASQYQVWVGNTFGSYDIAYSPNPATSATSTTISGLPTDGRTLYVRVYSFLNGTWYPRDYTYLAGP